MIQTLLRQLYPDQCPGCSELIQSEHALCPKCWADAHFIKSPFCDHCGIQLPGLNDVDEPGLVCDGCMSDLPIWGRARSVFMYSGTARSLVLGLKHGDRHDLIAPLVRWAADAIGDLVTDQTVFVPVPLHPFRFAKRRYNQSGLICTGLARRFGVGVRLRALRRKRHTPSLDGKTRQERFETLKDVIDCRAAERVSLSHKDVILVDDVMTTGATLTTCTQALQTAQPRRIDILTLARVGDQP